ncbi:MAG TPA: tRNA uridine-5-carboxymethylaminomethyl(34) synthesis GTPase MnmE [Gemmatimonadaceae bacterium]|nr:tRNA uridine-5-carboxymethylaminomethyl(34) synthesis GTPase MnmE [Gemmatimonadaceae bacterium]
MGAGVLPGADETIAAIATPAGRGALALVRVSGTDAAAVASRVLAPWPLDERRASLCSVRHPEDDRLLDRAVVTVYGNRSFTGEPMVEIVTHGGQVVPASVLAALIAAGARQALPGEFTRRAVVNGRLDLLQAEATADLIDARTTATSRAALAQLDGGLSRRIGELRETILGVEALIAYDIDFPEEDDGPVPAERIGRECRRTLEALDGLLETSRFGEMIRAGALVVLAGAPNVGKSSLFNALVGHARAIVTNVPGTTRDALEAVIDAGAVPLRLVDTAGLRPTEDAVERLGVETSERYLRDAEVIVACATDAPELDLVMRRVRAMSEVPVIAVATKRDLAPGSDWLPVHTLADSAVGVSAVTGQGLRTLVAELERLAARGAAAPDDQRPLLTRERHRTAVIRARQELSSFLTAWEREEVPVVVAAVHLRAATNSLEELIGAVDVEDVLDRVFASFCVGK